MKATPPKPVARFLRPKDFPQLELYRAENAARTVSRHVHFVHSIGVAEAGRRIHVTAKGSFEVTPGAVTIVRSDETHSAYVPPGECCSGRALRFAPDLMSALVAHTTDGKQSVLDCKQPVIHDPELAERILGLHRLFQEDLFLLEKETALLEVFSLLITRHSSEMSRIELGKTGQENRAILQVCGYLQERFQENVSLEELSMVTGLSPFYLCRTFTKAFGVPPHAYQLQVRLQHAADMLARGLSPIEVAVESGFFDQSHFHRAFKKKYGIPPGQYLRQLGQ